MKTKCHRHLACRVESWELTRSSRAIFGNIRILSRTKSPTSDMKLTLPYFCHMTIGVKNNDYEQVKLIGIALIVYDNVTRQKAQRILFFMKCYFVFLVGFSPELVARSFCQLYSFRVFCL